MSVIIPAYNAELTIGDALGSVFAQTYKDFEVIVVDDGSTDRTWDAVKPWRDDIIYVRQPNAGPGHARNTGIARSSGRLIAFLDADDQWLPEKLTSQVEYFRLFPQTGLLHTAAVISAEQCPVAPACLSKYSPAPPRYQFCELFETEVEVNTLTVMVSRSALDKVGGFDERREIHVEDWDLWLRIADHFPVGYLACPLAIRRPGGAMSTALESTFKGQRLVLEKALPAYRHHSKVEGRNPRNGMNRALHRLAYELGYGQFERNEMKLARKAFRSAMRHAPVHLRTYVYYVGSLLPAAVVNAVRAAKRPRSEATERLRVVPPEHRNRIEPIKRLQVAQDTVYGRARRKVTEHLHQVDDAIADLRGGPRRILFEAASPVSFAVFRPIYRRLCHDPRIQFYFTSTSRSFPAQALFAGLGITEHVVPPSRAQWMKFDACVNTDFYEMTWLHRRTARLHIFHGVAGKYGIDNPTHVAPDIASFDRVLFPNTDRLNRYLASGIIDERAALLVGYPKADSLVDGSLDRDVIARELRLRPDVPTVIYAPTWSPDSSLHVMGEDVVKGLIATGFNVVVKLHDRSYDLTRRASGGVDWAARLSPYEHHERVRVVRDPDASPYLMVADALVTDHSSIAFEYSLLDRPIVVLEAPGLAAKARINPEKIQLLRAAAEVVNDSDDVGEAIVAQLSDPGSHALARRRLASEMFYRPGTATDRATSVLYDAIRLEPPVLPAIGPAPFEPAFSRPARPAPQLELLRRTSKAS